MHTPSDSRWLWLLPIAAIGLGCSSTGRFAGRTNDPSIRTIASIGDRPLAAVAGVPTSSAVADLDDHSAPPAKGTRVSGRVVDSRGEPVPDARVRIADGGISGGRVIESTTDRTGGFTLRGLRPGSNYTLIAEYEGQGGWVEGRAEVRSPAAGVEIAVQTDELPADRRRADRAPSGRKISEKRAVDDEPIPSRVNQDDLPEGSDADDGDDIAKAAPTTRRRPAVTVSNSGGWRPSRVAHGPSAMVASPIDDRETRRASTRPPGESSDSEEDAIASRDDRRRAAEPEAAEPDDEEDNPLPPALEPSTKRGRGAGSGREPDPSAARPRASRRVSQAEPKRPGPPPGALTLAKDATPTPRPSDRTARREPEPAQAPAVEADAMPAMSGASQPAEAAYNPFPEPKKPTTWSDLSAAWDVDRAAGRPADADSIDYEPRPKGRPAPEPPAEALAARPRATLAMTAGTGPIEACRYDSQRRQILDFRLPDLDGRPVSLGDFDADYILLDFWGTWCRPCLTSVPHLVELQKRFEGRTLTVVGVACEDGPASANAAHVADVAKQLGINYTLLVSSKDDAASPMQEALHIQAFPTMILIDRHGRIVWRDQGATTTTLARLDRVLASSTKAGGSNSVRR